MLILNLFYLLSVFSDTHTLLSISSKPTPPQLDNPILGFVVCALEQVATQLGLDPTVIVVVKVDHPGYSEETCLRVLNRWFYVEPGSVMTESAWPSVLIALEEGGYMQVAVQLWKEQFGESCEGQVSELTPPLGRHACTKLILVPFATSIYGTVFREIPFYFTMHNMVA